MDVYKSQSNESDSVMNCKFCGRDEQCFSTPLGEIRQKLISQLIDEEEIKEKLIAETRAKIGIKVDDQEKVRKLDKKYRDLSIDSFFETYEIIKDNVEGLRILYDYALSVVPYNIGVTKIPVNTSRVKSKFASVDDLASKYIQEPLQERNKYYFDKEQENNRKIQGLINSIPSVDKLFYAKVPTQESYGISHELYQFISEWNVGMQLFSSDITCIVYQSLFETMIQDQQDECKKIVTGNGSSDFNYR